MPSSAIGSINQTASEAALSPFTLPHSISALACDDTPSFFIDFAEQCGWSLIRQKGARHASFGKMAAGAAAVVAWITPSTVSLLQEWLESAERYARPLLIAVGHDPDAAGECCDFFCMPNSSQLRHTLRSALALQTEAQQSRQALAALQAEDVDRARREEELALFRDALASNVAHELRTPMLQVKSAVAQLADHVREPELLINFAVQATSRLDSVIQDITMLADGLDIRVQPMVAYDVIEHALRERSRRWTSVKDEGRIQLEVDDQARCLVEGDWKGLSIVLQHLLDNGLKFSPTDKPVMIGLRREGEQVWFSVQDKGIGISRKHHARIFEPFYQVDSSSRRSFGGTGVGLTLVKMILDKHNTTLFVESERGVGSRFSFSLPVIVP